MKLKNIALTVLTGVSLIIGTANKSEANDTVEENRILASVNITIIGFAYGKEYINEERFEDGLRLVAQLHQQCKDSLITCQDSSETLENLGEAMVQHLSLQEIEEVTKLGTSEDFVPLVNQLLGY